MSPCLVVFSQGEEPVFMQPQVARELLECGQTAPRLTLHALLPSPRAHLQEILADMGIKVMGDVISILKHAKKVQCIHLLLCKNRLVVC